MISGKEGEIRKNLLGCRVNFSARMVITPIVDEHRINEIHLPYLTAIELYKYEILNTLVSKYDYQVKDAEEKIEKSKLTFDKSIYLIMNKILVNKNTKLMINRNPSLAYGSLLSMRISKIKEDGEI
jgi:DNA-directed RNA polymerase beta' subunit